MKVYLRRTSGLPVDMPLEERARIRNLQRNDFDAYWEEYQQFEKQRTKEVNIDTLEDLTKLYEQYDDSFVINFCRDTRVNEIVLSVEIYDDYRE